ncbi:MAG TPA: 30S ribosome-binding factor RbfA, partial [Bacteroidetes bacterium]|nr:30S ribosome-binding factor RbfA [Bacteroidota bacterium]
KRQRQIAETVKRHFSTVLQQEGSYIYGAQVLVTITNVKMTPDLAEAKIYLSVYNTENKQAVILQMEAEHFRLRKAFSARIRKHVRRIPKIQFFLDDTLDEMYRLNKLFDNLNENNQLGASEKEE